MKGPLSSVDLLLSPSAVPQMRALIREANTGRPEPVVEAMIGQMAMPVRGLDHVHQVTACVKILGTCEDTVGLVTSVAARLPNEAERQASTTAVLETAAAVVRIRGWQDPDRVGDAVWARITDPTGDQAALLEPTPDDARVAASVRHILYDSDAVTVAALTRLRDDYLPLADVKVIGQTVAAFADAWVERQQATGKGRR